MYSVDKYEEKKVLEGTFTLTFMPGFYGRKNIFTEIQKKYLNQVLSQVKVFYADTSFFSLKHLHLSLNLQRVAVT